MNGHRRSSLIEFACCPDSSLGRCGVLAGIDVTRFTSDGPDLSTDAGLQACLRSVSANPGADLWGSLPCTTLSTWQAVNLQRLGPSFARRLYRRRRVLICMLQNFITVALAVHKAGGTVSFEWPQSCFGWRLELMTTFFAMLPFQSVTVHGCALGLKGLTGLPVRKAWKIWSTNKLLVDTLQGCTCTRDHRHTPAAGRETARTAFYPVPMARIIVHALRQAWVPRTTVASDSDEDVTSGSSRFEAFPQARIEPNDIESALAAGSLRAGFGMDNVPLAGLVGTGSTDDKPVGFALPVVPTPNRAVQQQHQQQQHSQPSASTGSCSPAVSQLTDSLLRALRSSSSALPTSFDVWLRGAPPKVRQGRQRDVLPLPPLEEWPRTVEIVESQRESFMMIVNAAIFGLNMMAADLRKPLHLHPPGRATALQRGVQERICRQCLQTYLGMAAILDDIETSAVLWSIFEDRSATRGEALRPGRVDLPSVAGRCNPERLVDSTLWACVSDPDQVFPAGAPVCTTACRPAEATQGDYAKCVVEGVLRGKLCLRRQVYGMGTVFAVPKAAGARQREIWHGAAVSAAAAEPPYPEMQANPMCFPFICCSPKRPPVFSKRECRDFLRRAGGASYD